MGVSRIVFITTHVNNAPARLQGEEHEWQAREAVVLLHYFCARDVAEEGGRPDASSAEGIDDELDDSD